jgi:hypothetical protein
MHLSIEFSLQGFCLPHARQFRSPCDRSQQGRYQRHGNHQLTFSSCLDVLKIDMWRGVLIVERGMLSWIASLLRSTESKKQK